MNILMKIVGILALYGFYITYLLWNTQPVYSFVLGLVTLSFVIEMFKKKKVSKFDVLAGGVVFVGIFYALSNLF